MVSNTFKLTKRIFTTLLLIGASSVYAFDGELFGSFTSTIVNTDNTAMYGEEGTTILNQLTFNGYYKFTDQLSITGATNISNPYGENYHATLDYASLNYTKPLGHFFDGTVRLGRIKLDVGLLEQQRNNPTSRNTIFLPFGTYWPAFEHLSQSTDGIQIELRKYVGDFGLLSFSSTYGKPNIDVDDEKYITFGYFHHFGDNNSTKADGNMLSNTISFQNEHWQIKYNQTTVPLIHNLNFRHFMGQGDGYNIREQNQNNIPTYPFVHKYQTLGIKYSTEKLCLGGEIVKHDFPTEPIGMYVRGCYEVTDDIRVGIVYSRFSHLNNLPPPTPVPDWLREGDSIGVSITHNINSNTTIKAEYHKGHGTAWFPYPASSPDWDLFAVSLSYKFDILK